jgi:Zn finger protein HypA/HybF involved in hydrogenase expression
MMHRDSFWKEARMKRVVFICKRCGLRQTIEVFTPDEARERRRKGQPVGDVVCPQCGSWEYELR